MLNNDNLKIIENLYNLYLQDRSQVASDWREFFDNMNKDNIAMNHENDHWFKKDTRTQNYHNILIDKLLFFYRSQGYKYAKINPLNFKSFNANEILHDLLADVDLEQNINSALYGYKMNLISIKDFIQFLCNIYCSNIGVEFEHLDSADEKHWLYNNFENVIINSCVSDEQRKQILESLVEIKAFENILHKKFSASKSFSIEGAEAFIIFLEQVIKNCEEYNIDEIVLSLTHRGRLATLTKIMQKSYTDVFYEFKNGTGFLDEKDMSGDVKYHLGYSSDKQNIHLSLLPNPSHLESVNSVLLGKVYAKQSRYFELQDKAKILGIIVHGDAAFCGQGVIYENFFISALPNYNNLGTIHIIINNQIGFTAIGSDYKINDYCTNIGKAFDIPIIHVNGDDIESVIKVVNIAIAYRNKYRKNIIIDIVCYRKYGHNEIDDPMYTQSIMYNIIHQKQSLVDIYSNQLISQKVINIDIYQAMHKKYYEMMQQSYNVIDKVQRSKQWLQNHWSSIALKEDIQLNKSVNKSNISKIFQAIHSTPQDFCLHAKLLKLFKNRSKLFESDGVIDWAVAEQLAFATLLEDGVNIRMSGQDVQRGTFSHRHAILVDQKNGNKYNIFNNIATSRGKCEIVNSNLSEYGVLGFEYGFSIEDPNSLVIWEAQFGDFANGAQIIIDQFISSAKSKWMRMSGIILLLPHGYEGQGPEHSSARLERFLQLCAEDNMQVVYPTVPASLFHLYRQQIYSKIRRPLIVMSPKSLLRHPMSKSFVDDLIDDKVFTPVIDEIHPLQQQLKRIIFCTGKVYFDLMIAREEKNIDDIAIIRFERLYPFPDEALSSVIAKYSNRCDVVWCQEEPMNMGAWTYIQNLINGVLVRFDYKPIRYIGRNSSAAPATGCMKVHKIEQENIMNEAFQVD